MPLLGETRYPVIAHPVTGGYDITHESQTYEVRSQWRYGDALYQGTLNGQPICMQVERAGLKYRLTHWGSQADLMVVTARVAELQALMPHKAPPDLSRFLLSPMPGLLREVSVSVGQEVKAGEKLTVIEAMKMENVLKAEQDCVVAKLAAKVGDSLAVDQVIIEFK